LGSRDGNSTPNWRRNEKSGWKQYPKLAKQVDQTYPSSRPKRFQARRPGRDADRPPPLSKLLRQILCAPHFYAQPWGSQGLAVRATPSISVFKYRSLAMRQSSGSLYVVPGNKSIIDDLCCDFGIPDTKISKA
jgi:hypothetical protein